MIFVPKKCFLKSNTISDMLASFRESLKAARIWLFHEHAFRVSHEQRKRFSIQAQYDANETFRNLLQWSGTTLEVLNFRRCSLVQAYFKWYHNTCFFQFIFWKPITWIFLSLHYVGFFFTRALRINCPPDFKPANCTYDRSINIQVSLNP